MTKVVAEPLEKAIVVFHSKEYDCNGERFKASNAAGYAETLRVKTWRMSAYSMLGSAYTRESYFERKRSN